MSSKFKITNSVNFRYVSMKFLSHLNDANFIKIHYRFKVVHTTLNVNNISVFHQL